MSIAFTPLLTFSFVLHNHEKHQKNTPFIPFKLKLIKLSTPLHHTLLHTVYTCDMLNTCGKTAPNKP